MGVDAALEKTALIISEITVAHEERTFEVVKAYKQIPQQLSAAPSGIWAGLELRLDPVERAVSRRQLIFTIHAQVFFPFTNFEYSAAVASKFLDTMIDKFDTEGTLRASVSSHTFRGGDPTIGFLTHSGTTTVGIDVFLDCVLVEGKDFS